MRTLIGHIKGPKGDTGATGATGPVGPGATVTVGTVSTTAYGNTAEVTNSGTDTDAILDFVIPQGKPGEQTTKMSGLILNTVTASSETYPIPATGETGATVFGKIIKFFNDTKTAIASKVNISDIVNNLTSTATNKPLSAAQGKALNDAMSYSVHGPIGNATYLSNDCTVRREGRIVSFDFVGATKAISATSGYVKLFTMSEVYAPTENIVFLEKSVNNATLIFQVLTTGVVNIYIPNSVPANEAFRIHRTWPAN